VVVEVVNHQQVLVVVEVEQVVIEHLILALVLQLYL
jgi:hypothetical protein